MFARLLSSVSIFLLIFLAACGEDSSPSSAISPQDQGGETDALKKRQVQNPEKRETNQPKTIDPLVDEKDPILNADLDEETKALLVSALANKDPNQPVQITEDTIWDITTAPKVIDRLYFVTEESKLTISKGVRILFTQGGGLIVGMADNNGHCSQLKNGKSAYGYLNIRGTKDEAVIFEAAESEAGKSYFQGVYFQCSRESVENDISSLKIVGAGAKPLGAAFRVAETASVDQVNDLVIEDGQNLGFTAIGKVDEIGSIRFRGFGLSALRISPHNLAALKGPFTEMDPRLKPDIKLVMLDSPLPSQAEIRLLPINIPYLSTGQIREWTSGAKGIAAFQMIEDENATRRLRLEMSEGEPLFLGNIEVQIQGSTTQPIEISASRAFNRDGKLDIRWTGLVVDAFANPNTAQFDHAIVTGAESLLELNPNDSFVFSQAYATRLRTVTANDCSELLKIDSSDFELSLLDDQSRQRFDLIRTSLLHANPEANITFGLELHYTVSEQSILDFLIANESKSRATVDMVLDTLTENGSEVSAEVFIKAVRFVTGSGVRAASDLSLLTDILKSQIQDLDVDGRLNRSPSDLTSITRTIIFGFSDYGEPSFEKLIEVNQYVYEERQKLASLYDDSWNKADALARKGSALLGTVKADLGEYNDTIAVLNSLRERSEVLKAVESSLSIVLRSRVFAKTYLDYVRDLALNPEDFEMSWIEDHLTNLANCFECSGIVSLLNIAEDLSMKHAKRRDRYEVEISHRILKLRAGRLNVAQTQPSGQQAVTTDLTPVNIHAREIETDLSPKELAVLQAIFHTAVAYGVSAVDHLRELFRVQNFLLQGLAIQAIKDIFIAHEGAVGLYWNAYIDHSEIPLEDIAADEEGFIDLGKVMKLLPVFKEFHDIDRTRSGFNRYYNPFYWMAETDGRINRHKVNEYLVNTYKISFNDPSGYNIAGFWKVMEDRYLYPRHQAHRVSEEMKRASDRWERERKRKARHE